MKYWMRTRYSNFSLMACKIFNRLKRGHQKETIDICKCFKCHTDIRFVVPTSGYSNGSGSCSICGVRYTMMSNYGLVTLFPPGVREDYMTELFERVFASITSEEARDVLHKIDE